MRAFEAIVRAYQDRVYGLAWRLTYDAELARDIAQDCFLRLYERFDRYDPERPFEPWSSAADIRAKPRWFSTADGPPSRTSFPKETRRRAFSIW